MTASLSLDLTAAAENATLNRVLNCYALEMQCAQFPLIEGQTYLAIALPSQSITLLRKLDFRSELRGEHTTSGPLFKKHLEETPKPIGFSQGVACLLAELDAQGDGHSPNPHLNELCERILESCRNTKLLWEERLSSSGPASTRRFLEAEGGLWGGHALHPCPKSRVGFSPEDVLEHSPESGRRFPLHWALVSQALVEERGVDGCKPVAWFRQELELSLGRHDPRRAQLEGSSLTHVPLPLHPWQARVFFKSPLAQKLMAHGDLVDLGPIGEPWKATSSVRTVARENAPWQLKLSLGVSITNSKRLNLEKELPRGLEGHLLFQAQPGRSLQKIHPNFGILGDVGYVSVRANNTFIPSLSLSLRQNPFQTADKDVAPVAQLSEHSPSDSILEVKKRVDVYAQHMGQDVQKAAWGWWNSFLGVTLKPLLWLYDVWGMAYECHGQNLLVEFHNGEPVGGLYRDNQGHFHLDETHDLLKKWVPGLGDSSENYGPRDFVNHKLGYYLIFNSLFSVATALAKSGLQSESASLKALADTLLEEKNQRGDPRGFVHHILNSPLFSIKANMLTRRSGKDELVEDIMVQSVSVDIKNPFHFHSPYVAFSQVGALTGQVFSFRPVLLDLDFPLLEKWMHAPHVHPYWKLNLPTDALQMHFQKALQDTHQQLWMAFVDGEAFGYFESYVVQDDILGQKISCQPTDKGLHLLIGEKKHLGKGRTQDVIRAFTAFLFEDPKVETLWGEPDCTNTRLLRYVTCCGYEHVGEIDLPGKRAALLKCTRAHFASTQETAAL